jgi:hypothetical protein
MAPDQRLLVTVFSMPASAVTVFSKPASADLIGRGPAPRFSDIPDVSRNAEANPEHRPVQSTQQGSQSWDVTGQINDPARSEAN